MGGADATGAARVSARDVPGSDGTAFRARSGRASGRAFGKVNGHARSTSLRLCCYDDGGGVGEEGHAQREAGARPPPSLERTRAGDIH